ncbi:uncharacterized protein LOC107425009 [Ziziphus jujuba]|uniref:Uncharacterized protein LOC107425009 n=1 Tax=Ziziphus jujuba TaxID=326968 RepID=A0ABM4ADQ1_ZIZJJ|nr:uncharacterized protein LOC107425009 [Ziziphus jujuba]
MSGALVRYQAFSHCSILASPINRFFFFFLDIRSEELEDVRSKEIPLVSSGDWSRRCKFWGDLKVCWRLKCSGLELFRAKQYLVPHLMSTGRKSFRKRLLRRLMRAQLSIYLVEFPQICLLLEGVRAGLLLIHLL